MDPPGIKEDVFECSQIDPDGIVETVEDLIAIPAGNKLVVNKDSKLNSSTSSQIPTSSVSKSFNMPTSKASSSPKMSNSNGGSNSHKKVSQKRPLLPAEIKSPSKRIRKGEEEEKEDSVDFVTVEAVGIKK